MNQHVPEVTEEMSMGGLVEAFQTAHETMPDRAFAFVLGAGASRSSGIRMASDMVREWVRILHVRSGSDDPEEQWASAENLRIAAYDSQNPAASYSMLYDRLYSKDPGAGYAYLEHEMRAADPSYGYSVLARILEQTAHKVVITTNFDNLVADSLAIFSQTFPLVCGHEALASYVRARLRRPLVVKVHRDLLLSPKSSEVELRSLPESYITALNEVFRHYTPIIVGYGGNDGSLMGYLRGLEARSLTGGVYWCYLEGDRKPGEEICSFVRRQNGHLVSIPGFDQLMLLLGRTLEFNIPTDYVRRRAEERAVRIEQQFQELWDTIEDRGTTSPRSVEQAAAAEAGPRTAQKVAQQDALKRAVEHAVSRSERKPEWWEWQTKIDAADVGDRLDLYEQAVQELPDSAPLLGNFANFLWGVRMDHDRAQELYERAVQADPNHANNLANFAIFLEAVRKDHDRAQEFYERAVEADPSHVRNLANFALFSQNVRKDVDQAQKLFERAVLLDPSHANNLGSFALFLQNVRKDMDRAQEFHERAIQADPNDANTLGNFALFLQNVRKDMDRAQELYERAVHADPNHANNLGNFAIFLECVRKDLVRAQEFSERSVLADSNANNLGNLARLLLGSGSLERGRAILREALQRLQGSPPWAIDAECQMYAYCLEEPDKRLQALAALRKLVERDGVRTGDWDFSSVIAEAVRQGHPSADWLPRLADVLGGRTQPDSLSEWPEWANAA